MPTFPTKLYDLPSVEQRIFWMHAICGYPVKSMWLKAIKAGNFVGWLLLNETNITKYYPDTAKTHHTHMNPTQRNVHSTKHSLPAFQQANVGARRSATYSQLSAMSRTLFFLTKMSTFPPSLTMAINTKWLWSKLTAMPCFFNR